MTRDEIEEMFYWNKFPLCDELIDHVHQEYHVGPDAWMYTDQDAWEQTRKLARYYGEHRKLPEKLEDWMPGWTAADEPKPATSDLSDYLGIPF